MSYFIGIDVGTGSARAGLFDAQGTKLADASQPITLFRPKPNHVEQSSDNIWSAIVHCVHRVMAATGISKEQVKGLGFDATCSLVAVDEQGAPVSLSSTGEDQQNVIVWMDHRAIEQSTLVNQQGHRVLDFVGGKISPEMQVPKLMWIKAFLPEQYHRAAKFFDLPDYLTFKATGSDSRSLCSTVCKWTYVGHEQQWDADFFAEVGLSDLLENNALKIGADVNDVAASIGQGLSQQAAEELGLSVGTAVATSMIDAHAGGIGVLGAGLQSEDEYQRRIALIGGTSSCHMAVSQKAQYVPGVWGPYYSAMVPGLWLNEGGQSATGQLVDHILQSHPAFSEWNAELSEQGLNIYQGVNALLETLARDQGVEIDLLTRHIHVLPYFLGNRSPRANPHLTGTITGLTLDKSRASMALQYLATIQAIALGTRHIIDEMNEQEYCIDTIMACGGGTKNPVFLNVHASATGCQLILPKEPEAVILGAAMMGATAAGSYASLSDAMQGMGHPGKVVKPNHDLISFYTAKYRVFKQLYENDQSYEALMS